MKANAESLADSKFVFNGGSFAVTAARRDDARRGGEAVAQWLLEQEERMGLSTPRPYRDFEERVFRHRADLRRLLEALRDDGKKVLGYGASTKGNVILQFCGIDAGLVPAIAEVNPDKFGKLTPGSRIPIISEADARAMKPDYTRLAFGPPPADANAPAATPAPKAPAPKAAAPAPVVSAPVAAAAPASAARGSHCAAGSLPWRAGQS